jgi:hypothetical protein
MLAVLGADHAQNVGAELLQVSLLYLRGMLQEHPATDKGNETFQAVMQYYGSLRVQTTSKRIGTEPIFHQFCSLEQCCRSGFGRIGIILPDPELDGI